MSEKMNKYFLNDAAEFIAALEQEFVVTDIQFFKHTEQVQTSEHGYSDKITFGANIAINNDFMIQCAGDLEKSNYSIPAGDEACWSSEAAQDYAQENYALNDIIKKIEEHGFENNFEYLEENGDKM